MQDHTVNKRQPAEADCLKSLYFFILRTRWHGFRG